MKTPKTRRMSPARKEPDKSTYSGRFAVRLKMLRERAELSVQELAEILEVQSITVYKWEQAKSAPNVADLPKVAEALKLKSVRTIFPEK